MSLENLSIEELRIIKKKDEKTNLKKEYNKYKEDKEKQELINDILEIKNKEENYIIIFHQIILLK